MKNIIKKHKCQFVLASDFFRGFDDIHQYLSECGDFTWGDCNRSLVTVEAILDAVSGEDTETFVSHCKKVGLQTYVDLEN